MPKKKKSDGVSFSSCNLHLKGKGVDTNGNSVVKVSFPTGRAFSIQANRTDMPKTKSFVKGYTNAELIAINHVPTDVEREICAYVQEFGSDTQKKRLRMSK